MESPLQKMIDQLVIVKTGDVVYRGKLVEITEEAVSLQAKTGWREVSMERIVSIDLLPVEESPEEEADEDE
jgi:ABC-type Na+ transport system ATPase subunit NatA